MNLGNPCMMVSDFIISDEVWSASRVAQDYAAAANVLPTNVVAEVQSCCLPVERAQLEITRGPDWQEEMALSLTREEDLRGWLRQGPQFQALRQLRTTSEGLLIQTPDELAKDTRTYLWSPRPFEGDLWIEFDFRPESPRGLALLVACASGIQREDFIADHGLPKGGAMGTIISDRVRNYHWEFFRRVEAMRTDYETQVLVKNTWEHPLGFAVMPSLGQGEWHRLRFVKSGSRIHGSLDDRTVFDVRDEPWLGSGPVYNFGRIALRQMYHTTMRYRNLTVHTR
jgi:hypothetical protein